MVYIIYKERELSYAYLLIKIWTLTSNILETKVKSMVLSTSNCGGFEFETFRSQCVTNEIPKYTFLFNVSSS